MSSTTMALAMPLLRKSGRTTRLHSHVDSFKEPGVTWSTIEPQPTKACSAIAKTVTGSSSASMRRLVSGRLLPGHSAPISERALLSYSPLAPYRQNSIREICSGTEAAEHVRRKCPSGSNERSHKLRVPDRTSLPKTESTCIAPSLPCRHSIGLVAMTVTMTPIVGAKARFWPHIDHQ